MKKIALALLVAALAVPAVAHDQKAPKQGKNTPAVENQQDHKAFEKAREEHRAKMKATKEKMEKLVKEYNKLSAGKKKDVKRAEIEKEVGAIHEEQLKFKQEQLGKFEERLSRMKAEFDKENAADGRAAWTQQKTDALIKAGGDVRVLFAPGRDGGPRMGKGPHGKAQKGKPGFMGKGPKGPRPQGARPDFDNDGPRD